MRAQAECPKCRNEFLVKSNLKYDLRPNLSFMKLAFRNIAFPWIDGLEEIYKPNLVVCPECGKELKHKGALNGHLAFAHGIITPKGQTQDELRSEVKKLRSDLDCLYRFFKPAPFRDETVEQTDYLTAYDTVSKRGIRLEAMPEKSGIEKDGTLWIEAELIEDDD